MVSSPLKKIKNEMYLGTRKISHHTVKKGKFNADEFFCV